MFKFSLCWLINSRFFNCFFSGPIFTEKSVSLKAGAMSFQMDVDLSVKLLDGNELMRRVGFLSESLYLSKRQIGCLSLRILSVSVKQ